MSVWPSIPTAICYSLRLAPGWFSIVLVSFALRCLTIIVIDFVCNLLLWFYYCHVTGRDTVSKFMYNVVMVYRIWYASISGSCISCVCYTSPTMPYKCIHFLQVMYGSHSEVQYTRTTVLCHWTRLAKEIILPCSAQLTSLVVAELLTLVLMGLA